MLNLIINEYAKLFHKISTYILLGLIALFTIALPLLGILFEQLASNEYYTTEETDIDSEIEKLIDNKCREFGIEYHKGFKTEDWRESEIVSIYKTMYSVFPNRAEEIANLLADSEKWEDYYRAKIDLLNACSMNTAAAAEEKALDYRIKDNIDPNTDNPLNETVTEYIEELKAIEPDFIEYALKANHEEVLSEVPNGNFNLRLCTYLLENNINVPTIVENPGKFSSFEVIGDNSKYTYNSTLYSGVENATVILGSIVIIMLMVVASNMIAKEFSRGTIKFLLITPVKRSKIFWSKFLTLTSYAFIITCGVFLLSIVSNFIFSGDHYLNAQYITCTDGKFTTYPAFLFEAKNYFFEFFYIFIAMVFSFTLSSLFRSSGLAISMSFVIFYVSGNIVSVGALFNLDFLRFTIFPVMDLNSIFSQTTWMPNLTPAFAISVIAVHLFLMLLTAYDSFTRRNI